MSDGDLVQCHIIFDNPTGVVGTGSFNDRPCWLVGSHYMVVNALMDDKIKCGTRKAASGRWTLRFKLPADQVDTVRRRFTDLS